MKRNWIFLGAVYIFLAALIAYPQGAELAALVQHPVSFQVAGALQEAGWEEVSIGLAFRLPLPNTVSPIDLVYIDASDHDGWKRVSLYLGEGAPDWAMAAYEVHVRDTLSINPTPGYAVVTVRLSDQAALNIYEQPDRVGKTARIVSNYHEPVEPTRMGLWRTILKYGQTEIRY